MHVSRFNHVVDDGPDTYLFNAMTRGLYRVVPTVVEALGRLEAEEPDWARDIPEAYREELIHGGLVLDDGYDEHDRLRAEREGQRLSAQNIALTIAPTIDCNFGCPYCFEGDAKAQLRMTTETMDAIHDFVLALAADETDSLSVTWFGGEPLLGVPQIVAMSQRLLDIVNTRGWSYQASIVTNG